MSDKKTIYGPPADPAIVRQLTSHLVRAYEDFVNSFDGKVDYLDGFMAAHNFHVFIIEHLVEETGNPVWRNGAATTFEQRMKKPGEYDTKKGLE
jgi:predicted glycoside hydrolase/deacetylase ChbG (UPF0249 family)